MYFILQNEDLDSDPNHRKTIFYQIGADLVFFISLNCIGFYVKYVSEINMRRGFLDKRSCIETTFKLKYEKEQEVNNAISCLFTIICKYFLLFRKTCYWVFYQNTLQGKLEIVFGVTLRKAKIVPELHSSKFALHIHKEVRYRNVFR